MTKRRDVSTDVRWREMEPTTYALLSQLQVPRQNISGVMAYSLIRDLEQALGVNGGTSAAIDTTGADLLIVFVGYDADDPLVLAGTYEGPLGGMNR